MPQRHLVYYVCPFESNQEWLSNVQTLKEYWPTFTGLKVVTIAQGEGLVAPEIVQDAFDDKQIEFIVAPNNPLTGETPHFIPALSRLPHLTSGTTFYAHAKGVSPVRNEHPHLLANIRHWRNRMYRHCLGDPQHIDHVLRNYPCAGCFKLLGGFPAHGNVGDPQAWHFSGSFFWFRNAHFNRPEWDRIHQDTYGVEKYLSLHYKSEEGFCLYDLETNTEAGLYGLTEEEWLQADRLNSARSSNAQRDQ